MYRHEYGGYHGYHGYRGFRGFRFGCVPVALGLLLLLMLFSGGFHRLWFFAGPLFFGIPFFIAGVITTLIAMRWWKSGGPQHRQHGDFFGDFFRGEKAKRGTDDVDAETTYV